MYSVNYWYDLIALLDLLYHVENVRDTDEKYEVPPPSVDWFAHPKTPPTKEGGPGTPYESFPKDHWCQWDTSSVKLPILKKKRSKSKAELASNAKKKEEELKLPTLGPKKDDVDFRRLLSLDYQREWLDKRKKKRLYEKRKVKVGIDDLQERSCIL